MLKQIRKLCKPAYVYLVLSAITIILMMVQNAGASGTYKVGMYQCPCNNTAGIFLGKAIYVAFWTFILDAVCKAGYKSVSWFLVLFPMILGAVLVGLVLMSGGIREEFYNQAPDYVPPVSVSTQAYSSIESFFRSIFGYIRLAYIQLFHPQSDSAREWRGYQKLRWDASGWTTAGGKRFEAEELLNRYNDYKAHTQTVDHAYSKDGGYDYHRRKWFKDRGLKYVDPGDLPAVTSTDLEDTLKTYFPNMSYEKRKEILDGIKDVSNKGQEERYEDVTRGVSYSESDVGSDVGSGQDQGPRFTAEYSLGPRSYASNTFLDPASRPSGGSNTFLDPASRPSGQRQSSVAQKTRTENKYTTNIELHDIGLHDYSYK